MMRSTFLLLFLAAAAVVVVDAADVVKTWETQTARLTVHDDGVFFVTDLASTVNFTTPRRAVLADSTWASSAALLSGGSAATAEVVFGFGASRALNVTLAISAKRSHFLFKVVRVEGTTLPALLYAPYFYHSSTDASSMSGAAFDATTGLAMRSLEAAPRRLLVGVGKTVMYARAASATGFDDAPSVMFIAGPVAELRTLLQEAIADEDVLHSKHGGPWALDSALAKESYLFAYPTESTVDQWISMALDAGLGIIHFGHAYKSLGHYDPHPSYFPNGTAGLKSVLDKIHNAGLLAGLHTLSGAVDRTDAFLTPVPHSGLATDWESALSSTVDAAATTIFTDKTPLSTFDTVWTYSGRANVIRIGNELIQYSQLLLTSPFGFGGCTRGAFGTTASAHSAGATVSHMYVRYSTFQANENSTLVDLVAEKIGALHGLGFSYIYHDGAEGMPEGAFGEAIMRNAIFSAMTRETSTEASDWGNNAWPYHSRIGAWDRPMWGIKPIVDIHVNANRGYAATLLPTQLGWFAIYGQTEKYLALLPDEFEYLATKSLANDMAVSLQSLNPTSKPSNPRQPDFLAILKNWEKLRRSNVVPESVRELLKTEKSDFHIVGSTSTSDWKIVQAQYPSTMLSGATGGTVTVNNPFSSQPLRVRVQNLFSVENYDSNNGVELVSFSSATELGTPTTATGITASLSVSSQQGTFTLANTRNTTVGSWAQWTKTLASMVDLSSTPAFGLWILGDGRGEVLNFQPKTTSTYSSALDEHYVVVDFSGWKYVELPLMERDAERWVDYTWPYTSYRNVFIVGNDWAHISSLNVIVNNIPAEGCEIQMSAIRALPLVETTLSSISVTVAGTQVVSFPGATLGGGDYIELNDEYAEHARIFRKSTVENATVTGNVPQISSGSNTITVSYTSSHSNVTTRVRVTVIEFGSPVATGATGSSEGDDDDDASHAARSKHALLALAWTLLLLLLLPLQ